MRVGKVFEEELGKNVGRARIHKLGFGKAFFSTARSILEAITRPLPDSFQETLLR